MAVHMGFEPTPYSVTGRHLNHLTYEPFAVLMGFEPKTPTVRSGIHTRINYKTCQKHPILSSDVSASPTFTVNVCGSKGNRTLLDCTP